MTNEDFEIAEVMRAIDSITLLVHEVARRSGFYDDVNPDDRRHVASIAGLIGSEVNEIIETLRAPTMPPAKTIGGNFTHEEEEGGDVLIRHLDYCGWRRLRVGAAAIAKLEVNRGRGHRYGGKRF